MTRPAWHREDRRLALFVRNIGSRYALLALNAGLGLVVVPFNLQYLGETAYGLWLVTASITTWFSVLELGYGSATVRYIAEYRARGNARALNQIASTTFHLFAGLGLLGYAAAVVVAHSLPAIITLAPGQERTGRIVLLIIAANVSLHFAFAVYGGIVNGFERNYRNFLPGTIANIAATGANIAVLKLGYGLIELVAVTTAIRMVPYWFYRRNAYRVFPELDIRLANVRRSRFRELTSFSVYLAVIDWSIRLSYTSALIILGVFLNTAAVTLYSIGEKVSQTMVMVTNQLHPLLFPAVIHRAVAGHVREQQQLVVRAARLQLAAAIALAASTATLGSVLLPAWVERGRFLEGLDQSIHVLHVLSVAAVLRTWMAMPTTLLKATGHHRFVAAASATSGVASVLLGVMLVQSVGLIGVAWGTLLPAAVLASCAIFLRACAVLELPLARAYRQIVWPAVWPALPVMALLFAVRGILPTRLIVVLPCIGVGLLLYAGLFVRWGLGRSERQWMWSRLSDSRRRRSTELAAA